jgi:hypothetical protein
MLQASTSYPVKVLEKSHEMSERCVEAYLAQHTKMSCVDPRSCNIDLPGEQVLTVTVDPFMQSAKEAEVEKSDNNGDESVLPPNEVDNPVHEEGHQALRTDGQVKLVREGADNFLPLNEGH